MPYEMVIKQSRMWEIESRNIDGYTFKCCTIFYGSKTNKIIKMKSDLNIAYCIANPAIKIDIFIVKTVYRIYNFFILTNIISKIYKTNKIDVIISNSNALRELEIAALIISKLNSIPMLGYIGKNFMVDEPVGKKITEKITHIIETLILRYVDRVILRPKSEKYYTELYQLNPSKIITVPHITKFHKIGHSSKIPMALYEWIKGKKLIFYYGRLEKDKLVDDIIKAFHLVRESHDYVFLLIIGSGNDKNALKNLAINLGVNDYLRWEEPLSQKILSRISILADIHVHPTGGKGLLESAVIGRPVITNDSSTHDYGLIEHMKSGLKSEYRKFDDMAKCINNYLENPDLGIKHGKKLKEKALAHSDINKIQQKISFAIEDLISKRYL